MLVILPPDGNRIMRVISDDLLELLVYGEEVDFCFEWISGIDTKLGINFHTTCYVCEEFYIFALETELV
jgi:hypothetical protein